MKAKDREEKREPDLRMVKVSFGSVVVEVKAPSDTTIQANILDGQAALERAKSAFLKPGVKITRPRGKPIYFGSPDRPDVIIREVDGVRTTGRFVGGRFRALKDEALPEEPKKNAKVARHA